jgi:hypothetical protein
MKAGTMIPSAVRQALGKRAKGRCERCGKAARTKDAHHRLQRSLGGTHALSNLVAVCRSCHDKIHQQRRESREYDAGWLLRSHWDTTTAPLLTWAGWFRLNDYGEKFPTAEPEGWATPVP